MERLQCAWNRPRPQIAIALIPDQTRFMNIFAADIETEDRNRNVTTRFINRHQFMAANDLAPPDPVRVVQDNINRFDFRMRFEKRFSFGNTRARGTGLGHQDFPLAKRSDITSSNAAIRRSIWSCVVTGLTNIILWNGAIRQPRFKSAVCTTASTSWI